ncbi:MAG TPA: hypothetical protein VK661_01220 [Planctomycetota bacterium]|nr:hypothetical protein [Planctomycetota bacterium]
MSRSVLALLAGAAALLQAGCIDTLVIPPRPTAPEIVRNHAADVFATAFEGEADAKEKMGKFLEKLGDARTTAKLRAAWKDTFPAKERVLQSAISKSIHDPDWPVCGVKDQNVYVEGVRAAVDEFVGS